MRRIELEIQNYQIVKQIIVESLDVAFLIFNNTDFAWGAKKFDDVFNQILPSACVFQTAYWPFYKDEKGLFLCICEQFGIACRHKLSGHSSVHCIDMAEDPKFAGGSFAINKDRLKPVKYRITLAEIPPAMPYYGFLLSARVYLKPDIPPGAITRVRSTAIYSFVVNASLKFIHRKYNCLADFKFVGCPELQRNADCVLNKRMFHEFPKKIKEGFTMENKEIGCWTLCSSAIPLCVRVPSNCDVLLKEDIIEVRASHYYPKEEAFKDAVDTFLKSVKPIEDFLRMLREQKILVSADANVKE